MYARTIRYEDFDGNMREEEFLFHLTKAELMQWLATDGEYTLDKKMEQLYKKGNAKALMKMFDDLISISYGEKSLDGRRFDKSPEILANFKATEAYSELYTELVTDAIKAAEFFNGVIPKKLADQIADILDENPDAIPAEIRDYIPKKE